MEVLVYFFVPLVFIGMGIFILAIKNGWRKKNTNLYRNCSGVILKASKYETGLMSESSSPMVKFGVKLEYTYEVGEEKFVNDIIFKNADSVASSDEAWANSFIKEYPVGKKISVMVNPDNLLDTFLIENSPTTGFFNFLSIVMILIGVFVLFFNW